MDFKKMNAALNFWNLMVRFRVRRVQATQVRLTCMCILYIGVRLHLFLDRHYNLYGGSRTGQSTDKAIKDYISRGASTSKISFGLPTYGRMFENPSDLGKSYSGVSVRL